MGLYDDMQYARRLIGDLPRVLRRGVKREAKRLSRRWLG